MADLEQQLGAMLSNPQLMNQLFSMASAMGAGTAPPEPPRPEPSFPDAGTLRQLTELMGRAQPDPRQQELLRALEAYLPADRISRLRRAMQAARIAKYAAGALGASGGQGR